RRSRDGLGLGRLRFDCISRLSPGWLFSRLGFDRLSLGRVSRLGLGRFSLYGLLGGLGLGRLHFGRLLGWVCLGRLRLGWIRRIGLGRLSIAGRRIGWNRIRFVVLGKADQAEGRKTEEQCDLFCFHRTDVWRMS